MELETVRRYVCVLMAVDARWLVDLFGWLRGGGDDWPATLSAEQFKRRCIRRFKSMGAIVEPPTSAYDFLATVGDVKWAVYCFAEPREMTFPVFIDMTARQIKTRYKLMLVSAQQPTGAARAMAEDRNMVLLHYSEIESRLSKR